MENYHLQIDKRQFEKILRYIELGKQEGATLVAGGKPCGEKGFYIEPTIFTDVKVKLWQLKGRWWLAPSCLFFFFLLLFSSGAFHLQEDMKIFQDEIFGPVMSLMKFK